MTLIDNIKAIHGGSIFTIGVEDALLFEKKVFKNNEDVGLSDRKINYFYTRYDDRPIKIQKSKNKFSSCYPYEVVSPKILVLQFKDFDLDGIMYAVLNEFNKNYDSTTYEVGQVEIRKEIILKDEIGEIKPFEGTHILKFYYTESKPLNDCTEITCNGTEVIPITNEVLIYINDVLQYTQECNTDLELTLINQDGAPITATFNGTEIVVNQAGADANVQNSDASYNVNVVSGGALVVPDITISNSDDSYLVTSPSVVDIELPDITVQNSDLSYNIIEPSINNITLPDETITINSASFITKPSVKTQDILLKDVSGNTITPVSLVGDTISILDAVVDTGWSRPTEWIALPAVETRTLYGLYLVFENQHNQVDVSVSVVGEVEWDFENNGTTVLATGGVDSYVYDYNTIVSAISVYTQDGSNRNYKQVIFKMEWIGTNTGQVYLKLNDDSGINNNGTSGFADIISNFTDRRPRIVLGRHDYLRIFKCEDRGSGSDIFFGGGWTCPDIKVFEIGWTPIYGYQGMGGISIKQTINSDIEGSWDDAYVEGVNGDGVNISGQRATLGWINNISNTSTGNDTFWLLDAQILGTIDMPNSSFLRRTFQSCTTRKLIFSAIHPNPTNISSNSGAFRFMRNLEELIVPNLERGFNIDNSNMGATALDAMFTSLGTANGSQTITITGNPGAATCTTSIATAKGFTIVI
jgi:hypothetical protein